MKIPAKGKDITKKQLLEKLYAYCAYQERCSGEVRDKLAQLGVYGENSKEFENILIEEGFVDDTRYARVFAGGKFRIKKWGRNKIKDALRSKGLAGDVIEQGLAEVDEDAYRETLRELLEKKRTLLGEKAPVKRKKKLVDFAVQRGFEYGLVLEQVHMLEKETDD